MNKRKITSRHLSYLRLAYEVQKITRPYIKKGGMSLTAIYWNYVVEVIPVCINTFRKMMKEDVSNFHELAKAYKEERLKKYLRHLDDLGEKRKQLK